MVLRRESTHEQNADRRGQGRDQRERITQVRRGRARLRVPHHAAKQRRADVPAGGGDELHAARPPEFEQRLQERRQGRVQASEQRHTGHCRVQHRRR